MTDQLSIGGVNEKGGRIPGNPPGKVGEAGARRVLCPKGWVLVEEAETSDSCSCRRTVSYRGVVRGNDATHRYILTRYV